jgi:Adenylate and Guanylate cyclase catalytic domain
VDLVTLAIPILLLVVIAIRPTSYVTSLHVMFVVIVAGPVLDTAMLGGLLPSGFLVIFVLDVAPGALLAISLRAGIGTDKFGVFVLSVVYAVAIPHWVDPIYALNDPTENAAFNLIATGVVTMALMIYFIRQRDRFQRRSDDLLHAILPDQIAAQLKDEPGTIADDVPSASVLFADVVDFTAMSATMSPAELVEMLDELFTVFAGFLATVKRTLEADRIDDSRWPRYPWPTCARRRPSPSGTSDAGSCPTASPAPTRRTCSSGSRETRGIPSSGTGSRNRAPSPCSTNPSWSRPGRS